MTYQDVEYKLAQYAQWCGNPLRPLDYPGRSIYARAIPDAIDPEALPEMTDDEARVVGEALLALKRNNHAAYATIKARFLHGMVDDAEVGRRCKLGSKMTVWRIRQQAYSFLQCWFFVHDDKRSTGT